MVDGGGFSLGGAGLLAALTMSLNPELCIYFINS